MPCIKSKNLRNLNNQFCHQLYIYYIIIIENSLICRNLKIRNQDFVSENETGYKSIDFEYRCIKLKKKNNSVQYSIFLRVGVMGF